MTKIYISILPVLFFLSYLVYLDSFKLIKKQVVAQCIFYGAASAIAAYFINSALMPFSGIDYKVYTWTGAPLAEEILKAAFLLVLIQRSKVAFMIDGAIAGFAIGAGFASIENIFYLNYLPGDNLVVWIVRGLGTAVMHGGATAAAAIFILGRAGEKPGIKDYSIGILAAVIIHSLYNQFFIPPFYSALAVFFAVPVILMASFSINEQSLRKWLELELDSEMKLLTMIGKGEFAGTRAGKYIMTIRQKFPDEVMLDILCFIKLYIELSIRAKGNLMMNEFGFQAKKDESVKEKLKELKFLEGSIGKTGLYAISPVLRMSQKDLWKLNMLN